MTASKDRLTTWAEVQTAARQDFERPALHQLIFQARRDRAQYTAALLWRLVARLRSTFQTSTRVMAPVRSDA